MAYTAGLNGHLSRSDTTYLANSIVQIAESSESVAEENEAFTKGTKLHAASELHIRPHVASHFASEKHPIFISSTDCLTDCLTGAELLAYVYL